MNLSKNKNLLKIYQGQEIDFLIDKSDPVKVKKITFYNRQGEIANFNYNDFMKAVKKIRNHDN